MPESIFDESAHRQVEAEMAAAGDSADAQLAAQKRAAALGLAAEAAPTGRHAQRGEEAAAEAPPQAVEGPGDLAEA